MEDMKKTLYIIILAAVMCLPGCNKQGPASFKGHYSFKTGGSIDVTGKLFQVKVDTVKIDTIVHTVGIGSLTLFRDSTFNYHTKNDTISSRDTVVVRHLGTESGQMHILSKEGDEMILTMNITAGDPVVFPAKASGSDITLGKTRRFLQVHTGSGLLTRQMELSVSGTGKRYDNMVLLDLEYEGDYHEDGFDGVVTASRVNCIATENE